MGETSVLSIQHIGEMEMEAQRAFCAENKRLLLERYGRPPKALVRAFGCAPNMDDGDKIRGMLAQMGCQFTDSVEEADIALYNTCAIRENAEQKVFGILGQATHQKESRRGMLIALCGCMAQQKEVSGKLKKSFPSVDLVFGPHALYKLPQLLHETLLHAAPGARRRVYDTEDSDGVIAEGIPTLRTDKVRAGLPIMYGCNNFCTYCVVPLVRGRERSRMPEDILAEARGLIAAGVKEITLLGQNVNSYGKGGETGMDFPELLEAVASLPGDFWVRFMTSHPRDCTRKLIDVIARSPKVCRCFHLPVQSGNDRVLRAMNRHYTRAQYLDMIRYAKETVPGIRFTSDIIVGFPGETREEFADTLSLVREVGYQSLFTFIFSPRPGTKAAGMDDPVPAKEKSRWFNELLAVQKECGMRFFDGMEGKTVKVLCEGYGKEKGILSGEKIPDGQALLMGRTEEGMVADFFGDAACIGQFVPVKVTKAQNFALAGAAVCG